MLHGVVTGTSSGSPCMDATSFLYTTLAFSFLHFASKFCRVDGKVRM